MAWSRWRTAYVVTRVPVPKTRRENRHGPRDARCYAGAAVAEPGPGDTFGGRWRRTAQPRRRTGRRRPRRGRAPESVLLLLLLLRKPRLLSSARCASTSRWPGTSLRRKRSTRFARNGWTDPRHGGPSRPRTAPQGHQQG